MNWEEFSAARQQLAEETYGHLVREAEAQEDAAFEASVRALGRQ